jgi:hypothetical protein
MQRTNKAIMMCIRIKTYLAGNEKKPTLFIKNFYKIIQGFEAMDSWQEVPTSLRT